MRWADQCCGKERKKGVEKEKEKEEEETKRRAFIMDETNRCEPWRSVARMSSLENKRVICESYF